MTQTQEKIELELRDLRASLAGRNDESAISRLIALTGKLLGNQELILGCARLVREKQLQTGVCAAKLECEKRFGTERSRQLLDGLGLFAERLNDEAVAFLRSVALDPRIGPRTRRKAIEILETIAANEPVTRAQIAAVRDELEVMTLFYQANKPVLAQLGRKFSSCPFSEDQDVVLVVAVAPDGKFGHAISPVAKAPAESCVLEVLQGAQFQRLQPPRSAVVQLRIGFRTEPY